MLGGQLHPFVFDIARLRVVFGRGTRARTVQEVESLGAKQVLVVASPSHARSRGGPVGHSMCRYI
jgi:ribosomal 30S subunit maturation factor RimM